MFEGKLSCDDRYIFSLASNPFYLWLICTIFYEAGEGYVPTTLTQVLLLSLFNGDVVVVVVVIVVVVVVFFIVFFFCHLLT